MQPFAYEEIDLGFSHVSATTQKTAGHDKHNTKINESPSACLKFAQRPVWIKKEIISFTVVASAKFHPPVVKNVVLTLFQGDILLEDQHPWLSLCFSIYIDKSRKSLLAKVDCWHAITSVMRLLGDFGIQEVIRRNLLKKRYLQRKNCLHFALLQHQILVHGRGVQVF